MADKALNRDTSQLDSTTDDQLYLIDNATCRVEVAHPGEVLKQKQRRSAVHLHLAEVAPRRADRAISSELTIEADLAFVKPHRVDGCAHFRLEGRELRRQRRRRARLRFVIVDPKSTKLSGHPHMGPQGRTGST
jgi:hypothetical protein